MSFNTLRVATLTIVVLCTPFLAHAQTANPVMEFDDQLQPGVWSVFRLGPSSMARGYVVDITPTSTPFAGTTIEKYVLQPEAIGAQWEDTLRVLLSPMSLPLDVSIRVYAIESMPIVSEFNTRLLPGVWHGFWIGRASWDRAYVPEISPIFAPAGCTSIYWNAAQQEFNGYVWNDVFRLMTPGTCPETLDVNVRVYEIADIDVAFESDLTLEPGMPSVIPLGPSSLNRVYVADISPLSAPSGCNYAGTNYVTPEFDGTAWTDVLRTELPHSCAPLPVKVRVYKLPNTEGEIHVLTSDVEALRDDDVLNDGQSNSLTTKLDQALARLDQGRTNAAAGLLRAFINQVTDLVSEGTLTVEQGQALTDCAEAILADLDV